jgi:hypothetical protein
MAWAYLLRFVVLSFLPTNRVGLSLSFCIQDILEGRETRCGKIISSTKAEGREGMRDLTCRYLEFYWSDYPIQASLLLVYLLLLRRLEQPRLEGHDYHNISRTHWLVGPVARLEGEGNGDILISVPTTEMSSYVSSDWEANIVGGWYTHALGPTLGASLILAARQQAKLVDDVELGLRALYRCGAFGPAAVESFRKVLPTKEEWEHGLNVALENNQQVLADAILNGAAACE